MKKIIAIALFLGTSSLAFADTWNCICTQQDDFGACIAWQCTRDSNPGVEPTSSHKPASDEQLLEQVLSKSDPKAEKLTISTK